MQAFEFGQNKDLVDTHTEKERRQLSSIGKMLCFSNFDVVLSAEESKFSMRKPFIACNDDTCELADKVLSESLSQGFSFSTLVAY